MFLVVATLATLSAVAQTKTYKVGDLYEEAGRRGVVFEVSAGGSHGKIVSVEQTPDWLNWSLKSVRETRLNATSKTDGQTNTAKVYAQPDWQQNYPLYAWCASLPGEGWYVPAIDELMALVAVRDVVNATLAKVGAKKLYYYLWSSTEHAEAASNAWIVDTYYPQRYNHKKSGLDNARAVARF